MVTRRKGRDDAQSGGRRYSGYDEDQALLREARRETTRATRLVGAILLALTVVAIGLAWWARTDGRETGSDDGSATPVLQSDAEQGLEGSAATGGEGAEEERPATAAEPENGTGSGSALPEPPTDGPYVDATLTDNVFVLSGVVPSEDIKQLLEARAEVAYAPFNSSQLEVDESVGQAGWLASAAEVIGLLPMITDGTIRVQDDAVTLTGRSPNPEYAAGFQQAVGQLTGLPVAADGIEITDLSPPRFVATVEDGQVALEGEMPSPELVQTLIGGAASVYGADNVTSTMTVDEGTYTSFWNYTMPGVFELFAPFPAYRIQVENGVTSGTLRGGVLFELNSAEISPEAADVLGIGVAVLARDRSLEMTVVGHTDDRGPDDLNRRLSLARAQSVVDFLVAAGIDPARLGADGRGSDEPLASNDTPEGRALNRRVEFLFD